MLPPSINTLNVTEYTGHLILLVIHIRQFSSRQSSQPCEIDGEQATVYLKMPAEHLLSKMRMGPPANMTQAGAYSSVSKLLDVGV